MGEVRARLHELHYSYTPAIAEFLIQASYGVSESEGEVARPPPDPRKSVVSTLYTIMILYIIHHTDVIY